MIERWTQITGYISELFFRFSICLNRAGAVDRVI